MTVLQRSRTAPHRSCTMTGGSCIPMRSQTTASPSRAFEFAVFAGKASNLTVVFSTGHAASSFSVIAARAFRDSAENGTRAQLPLGSGTVQAVAYPWFSESGRIAGAVVAYAPAATRRIQLVVATP